MREMKKYLMNHLKVPENAIIMEPHARHTTTNLRNGARLIYRYGIPFDKAALTSTSRGQSSSIGRCLATRRRFHRQGLEGAAVEQPGEFVAVGQGVEPQLQALARQQ